MLSGGFRANTERLFPDLPIDTAWASGASDQRIFILRRHRLTVAVANETDFPMDLAALNRVIATAIGHTDLKGAGLGRQAKAERTMEEMATA